MLEFWPLLSVRASLILNFLFLAHCMRAVDFLNLESRNGSLAVGRKRLDLFVADGFAQPKDEKEYGENFSNPKQHSLLLVGMVRGMGNKSQ